MYPVRLLESTRGQARFARRPLVVRLGDSRIRLGLGDSGGDANDEVFFMRIFKKTIAALKIIILKN